MRVALLSYPMLYQAKGGLQIQILETVRALRALGVDAVLADPVSERLTAFDVVHVFSVMNGNHRIVEVANALGVPVVVSPLLREHWTASLSRRAAWLERVVGRFTDYEVKTEYRQIRAAIEGAAAVVALGPRESESLRCAFHVPESRVAIIENGIAPEFFLPSPDAFCKSYGVERGFVLCVASINPHKNQMGLARALAGSGKRLVLVGGCLESQRSYLAELEAMPHVRYVGGLNYGDPRLASAYAAASVLAIVSQSEVMPLCVLEALAAGTPAVMTRNHSMDLTGISDHVYEVNPQDGRAIGDAVRTLCALQFDRKAISAASSRFSWTSVAARLARIYTDVSDSNRRPIVTGIDAVTEGRRWLEEHVI